MRVSVAIHGARGSLPGAGSTGSKYGVATSSVSVVSGETGILLDAGSGVASAGAALLAEGIEEVDLFLTHLHLDHVIGLPFLPHLARGSALVRCHVADEAAAEALEALFRPPYFPLPIRDLPGRLEISVMADVLDVGAVRVTALALNHPGRALGFRLEWPGHALAYAPDVEPDGGSGDAVLLHLLSGADLALVDATYRPDEMTRHRNWGHGDAVSVARLAAQAGVKRLGLFHHLPGRKDAEIDAMVALARGHHGDVFAAGEGQSFAF